MEQEDGTRIERTRGTPQGGVVSPILSNLFLHYTFDLWMRGHTPTSRGVGMRMTGWCTAGASKKPRPSRPSFKLGWRNAAWSCIPPKPRSSTARTESAKGSIRTSSLTSSDIASGRGWSEASRNGQLFCGFTPSGQFLGAESHAGDDPGLEHPATNTAVAGRHRPQAQSAPPRVDRILRAIRAFGTVPHAPVRQSDASRHGRCGSSSASRHTKSAPVSFCNDLHETTHEPLRSLADRHDRHVCLMGAE